MLAEDQFAKLRPLRWKKGERPTYRLTVQGITREDERTLKATAKAMGCSFPVFFAVLAAAFRDHRVIILPDGSTLDALIEDRLVRRIEQITVKRVSEVMADANLTDGYMR